MKTCIRLTALVIILMNAGCSMSLDMSGVRFNPLDIEWFPSDDNSTS